MQRDLGSVLIRHAHASAGRGRAWGRVGIARGGRQEVVRRHRVVLVEGRRGRPCDGRRRIVLDPAIGNRQRLQAVGGIGVLRLTRRDGADAGRLDPHQLRDVGRQRVVVRRVAARCHLYARQLGRRTGIRVEGIGAGDVRNHTRFLAATACAVDCAGPVELRSE